MNPAVRVFGGWGFWMGFSSSFLLSSIHTSNPFRCPRWSFQNQTCPYSIFPWYWADSHWAPLHRAKTRFSRLMRIRPLMRFCYIGEIHITGENLGFGPSIQDGEVRVPLIQSHHCTMVRERQLIGNLAASNHSFSHELGSEWASERTNERSVARERSDQCGTSEWVSGANKRANGWAKAQYLHLDS